MNLTTNNGIESQNKLLKYSFLKNHTTKSLSNIPEVIIEDYIPSALNAFEVANTKISGSYKRYNHEIPEFLHNRPVGFIKHTYNRFKIAENIYSPEWIKVEEENWFRVRSETDPINGTRSVGMNRVVNVQILFRIVYHVNISVQ